MDNACPDLAVSASHRVTVTAIVAPDIAVTPPSLAVMLTPDDTDTSSLVIANQGNATLNWGPLAESPDVPWLTESLTNGNILAGGAPHTVTLTFDSGGLLIGAYTTTLQVPSNDPVENLVEVDVTLVVTSVLPAPDIAVTPPSLSDTLSPTGTVTYTLTIANQGNAALNWGPLAENPAADWLNASPISGDVPVGGPADVVTVTFDANGQSVGVHSTILQVPSNDPDEPTVNVPITLTVASAAVPDIALSPAAFDLSVIVGQTTQRALVIHNEGTAELTLSSLTESPNAAWLGHDFVAGAVAAGGASTVTLTFDASALTVNNTYTTTLQIANNDPDENPAEVQVRLTVEPHKVYLPVVIKKP